MATLRSIKIVQAGNRAAFQPDPAGVQAGDRIHWNNETNNDHQLQMSDGFMTDNIPGIPGGAVSNPGYPANADVSYRCLIHPQEQGTIQIVPAVVMAAAVVPAAAVPAVASSAAGAAAPFSAPAQKKGGKKKAAEKRKAGEQP